MKKIIYTFMAFALLAASSCEEKHLDIEQKGAVALDNFYQTDADCEQALAAAYADFATYVVGGSSIGYSPLRMALNCLGDDFSAGGATYGDHDCFAALNEYRFDANNEVITNLYNGLYKSIYSCNLVMTYFGESRSEPTLYMKQAAAEARVLRACDYFYLALFWGQPPFVEGLLSADARPGNNEKTQKEYYEWVAAECQVALGNLTERKDASDKAGAVRVTIGFANALAGKAYLFAGYYPEAQTALKKVIDSGKYALVPSEKFANLFHVEGDGNGEKVFELNLEYIRDNYKGLIPHSTWKEANLWAPCSSHFVMDPFFDYTGGINGWGGCGIPKWFADAFVGNDGAESWRCLTTMKNILNIQSEAEEKGYTFGISDVRDGLYGQSFWIPVKPIVRGTDYTDGGGSATVPLNNAIVMRYAEVLLMYAEAMIGNGNLSDALTYINMIQNRAGSKTISSPFSSADEALETLKKEKMYELCFEGCRWPDVIRWNDAEGKARLAKAGNAVPKLYDKLHRTPQSTEKPIWQYGSEENSRFYMLESHEAQDRGYKTGFQEGKHNLFPYPQSAIDRNPNLKQNPGW